MLSQARKGEVVELSSRAAEVKSCAVNDMYASLKRVFFQTSFIRRFSPLILALWPIEPSADDSCTL